MAYLAGDEVSMTGQNTYMTATGIGRCRASLELQLTSPRNVFVIADLQAVIEGKQSALMQTKKSDGSEGGKVYTTASRAALTVGGSTTNPPGRGCRFREHHCANQDGWDLLGDWTSPPVGNGWSNYGGSYSLAGYKLLPDGFVQLRGLVKGAATRLPYLPFPLGFDPLAPSCSRGQPLAASLTSE